MNPDAEFDFFISEPLQCASALREHLGLDEESYLRVAGQSHADARAYVVYTALDEVQKTSMWLMRVREFVQGDPVKPSDGTIERLLHTHLREERDTRVRRLFEVLVTLALFGQTNDQAYYRHLLALELLDEELSAQNDTKEFWGAASNNLAASIASQIAYVRHCEADVTFDKCWYLIERKPLRGQGAPRPGRILSSMRARIMAALPLLRDREKLLFGFTYGASYGRTSESMHYSPDRRDYRLMDDDDVTGRGHLALLSLEILVRCQELLGNPRVPQISRLAEILAKTDGAKLSQKATTRPIGDGDFVLANGMLAEVREITTSRYGYQSFRVRFLAERHIPEVDEDWVPALHVQRLYTKSEFFSQIRAMADTGKLPKDLEERLRGLSDDKLQEILGASMTNVWHLGMREWIRARQAALYAEQRKRPASGPGG